jgi:succinate dehydrogenase/fumarate reductase flavoprotein subunit
MEEFDAVVVGAGNGGLTASTALAQKGRGTMFPPFAVPGSAASAGSRFCRERCFNRPVR